MLALWRFDFLTTSQIGAAWWAGRDASRPRDRLARLAEVGLLRRCRPLVRRGTNEWIYSLARSGFDRLRDEAVGVTQDARFSERRLQTHRTEHVLRVNDWLLAYAALTGHRLTDWRGSREAQPVCADAPCVEGMTPALVSPDAAGRGLPGEACWGTPPGSRCEDNVLVGYPLDFRRLGGGAR